ncbi:MAG: ABC transporter permease [Candidatus Bathyarchaeales archaeon]
MLSGLGSIVVKEIKELVRDPKILIGMIIVPLIMFPLMGLAVQTSRQSAEESLKLIPIAVADFDQTDFSRNLTNYIGNQANLQVAWLNVQTIDDALDFMRDSNATVLIVIPRDFGLNLSTVGKGTVEVFSVFTGKSMIEDVGSQVVNAYLDAYNSRWEPLALKQSSIVKGEPVNVDPQILFGLTFSQVFIMPFTILMLLIFAMQIAATSVAMEKEEKTLETLLTVPVSRFTILAGKLAGSVVVALVGAVAYLVGFVYYFSAFNFATDTGGFSVDLATLGLIPSPLGYVLIGASLFVSLLSALALAVVLSAFADDVRGAQSLVGFLYVLFILPMFFMMFSDINTLPLPLRILLLAIPYTHPMLAAKASITGDYLLAGLGVIYVSLFTVVVLYLAARLFATEKILTMKLKFSWFRRGKKLVVEELQ